MPRRHVSQLEIADVSQGGPPNFFDDVADRLGPSLQRMCAHSRMRRCPFSFES